MQGVTSPVGSANTSIPPSGQVVRGLRTVPANHFTQVTKPQRSSLKVGPTVIPTHRETLFLAVSLLYQRNQSALDKGLSLSYSAPGVSHALKPSSSSSSRQSRAGVGKAIFIASDWNLARKASGEFVGSCNLKVQE